MAEEFELTEGKLHAKRLGRELAMQFLFQCDLRGELPEMESWERFFEQMKEIYALLHDLDISSYPATYDPINDPDSDLQIMSEPSMTLILTVRLNESEKTVACRDISMQFKGYNEKSQKFLDVCKTIKDVLTATEEWKALPEYEFLYD